MYTNVTITLTAACIIFKTQRIIDFRRICTDGYSFHKLAKEHGWLAFRQLEYRIIKRFASMNHAIIYLDVGTVRYEWNLDALKGTGLIVFLTPDT